MENQENLINLIIIGSLTFATINISIRYNRTREEIKSRFNHVYRKLFDKLNQLDETERDSNLQQIVNSFEKAYNDRDYPSIREWHQAKRLMEKYELD